MNELRVNGAASMVVFWDNGWRRFLVLSIGRTWVTLFSATSVSKLKVAKSDFERQAKRVEFNPRTVRRIIRANVALRKRLKLGFSRDAAKTALAMLDRGATPGEPALT